MPSITINRIELKSGAVYKTGDEWPGSFKDKNEACQLRVGPIFFRPEFGESETESEGEDKELGSSERHPAHYEIWCVTDRLFKAFFSQVVTSGAPTKVDQEELFKAMSVEEVMRRAVNASDVVIADEVWPALHAFKLITSRYVELSAESDDEEEEKSGNGTAQVQEAASG